MTDKEALQAIGELLRGESEEETVEHLFELSDKIVDKVDPFELWDSDADTGFLEELDEEFDEDFE